MSTVGTKIMKPGRPKGFKHSEETRRKMSESAKRVGKGKWMEGRQFTAEHRQRIGNGQIGDKNNSWKDGRSSDDDYRSWIKNKRNRLKRCCVGNHTRGEWEALKEAIGYECLSCKRKEPDIKLTQDHIVPVSKAGTDDIENIQPLCRSCNSRKNNRIIKYYNIVIKYKEAS